MYNLIKVLKGEAAGSIERGMVLKETNSFFKLMKESNVTQDIRVTLGGSGGPESKQNRHND